MLEVTTFANRTVLTRSRTVGVYALCRLGTGVREGEGNGVIASWVRISTMNHVVDLIGQSMVPDLEYLSMK